MSDVSSAARAFERRIGRVLVVMTYVAVGLLLAGVVLMLTNGISPLAESPAMVVGSILPSLLALDPLGFLWLGLIVVIATPITRVVIAGFGYVRAGDWLMVAISIGILLVIAVGITVAVVEGG